MIRAAVTIIASPGQREGLLEALRSLLSPTPVEPGCERCQLFEDIEARGAFTLVEEWATSADFDRRLRSEAYRWLLLLMEQSVAPPEVRFELVSYTRGMEAIHAARGA
jgi:quinol monooxygenase YgiN